jgi:hypothetical protein
MDKKIVRKLIGVDPRRAGEVVGGILAGVPKYVETTLPQLADIFHVPSALYYDISKCMVSRLSDPLHQVPD